MKILVQLFTVLLLLVMSLPTICDDDPFPVGVVRKEAALIADEGMVVGLAWFWNSRLNFLFEIEVTEADWFVTDLQAYVGLEPPPIKKDKPNLNEFNCHRDFAEPTSMMIVQCFFPSTLTFEDDRTIFVALHGDLLKVENGNSTDVSDFWVFYEPTPVPFDGLKWGWYFITEWYRPEHGHFID